VVLAVIGIRYACGCKGCSLESTFMYVSSGARLHQTQRGGLQRHSPKLRHSVLLRLGQPRSMLNGYPFMASVPRLEGVIGLRSTGEAFRQGDAFIAIQAVQGC
jgi:hypothetical protein